MQIVVFYAVAILFQDIAWKIEDLKAAEDDQNRKSLFEIDDRDSGKA